MVQHIRLSQFVITWGPGSILEGQRGPRLIPAPDIGLFYRTGLTPDRFEISDQRMSYGLLGGNRIFRLPSNTELGIHQQQPVYFTRVFPEWRICHNVEKHKFRNYLNFSVLYFGPKCPLCNKDGEAVRFVSACPKGHLDDVDWIYIVHGDKKCFGQPDRIWFMWIEEGSSLAFIYIKCPVCGAQVNLKWAYDRSWPCTGRFPEREPFSSPPKRDGCDCKARLILRQASNLRIPELKTLFTIPPRYTRLHHLLLSRAIYPVIVANPPSSMEDLKRMLNNLYSKGLLSDNIVREILNHPWDEIKRAIKEIHSPVPENYSELLVEELHAFIDGSVNGIPPVRHPRPFSQVLIEINPAKVTQARGPNGTLFRIVPITRLRTVIVQTGYRREVDISKPASVVDVSFQDYHKCDVRWYPGVEFFGEGIFIIINDRDGWQEFNFTGVSCIKWFDIYSDSIRVSYPDYVFRDPRRREELHPAFVWWHTLSHLLIRAISEEAGYPSASIRERVYLELKDDRIVRGGILLYAVQPGSEGTMGGLISLVPHFQKIFERAFNMLKSCSGDPLCFNSLFTPGHYCGAACYGCLFLSETSCEHRNMWLDRKVLMENLP